MFWTLITFPIFDLRMKFIVYPAVLFILFSATIGASAYDICTCNQLTCDSPVNCSHGAVLDQCGCCMVCARGKHELCGGRLDGVCADGLQCVIHARPGDLVTGREQGTCQEIPQGCDPSTCDSIITHRCPSDSVLVYNGTQDSGACCKTTYSCRCDTTVCKVPKCAAGHTAQIIRHSNNRPGSCCDMYHCKVSGCWSVSGKVYKTGETWREGDCVTCHCVNGKKHCQAEMCVKTCKQPKYVPGRCCPICDSPSVYPDQPSSDCRSLATCNITCTHGLQQTPDGCHICKCKPRECTKDCRYGYTFNEIGEQQCECDSPPTECPDLDLCSKFCHHGYKMSKKGCPKCRCHRCTTLTCNKICNHGYQTDRHGCKVCKCQETLWQRNCTVNMTEYVPGQTWNGGNCDVCSCSRDGAVTCEPQTCPVLSCLFMVRKEGDCCPVCLNVSITHISPPAKSINRPDHSNEPERSEQQSMEKKYVVSLAIVSAFVVILLILVFVLLYLKMKQRHQASWSVAGQDSYCKCPLFIGHSPTLQHKYNLDGDISNKLGYNPVIVQKYDQPLVDSSLKSDSILDSEQKSFLSDSEKDEKDFMNEDDCKQIEKIETESRYKEWPIV